MASLQFAPWTSDIELAFYAALASLKINHDKLDDSARRILGLYEIRPSDRKEMSTRMQIFGSAFRSDEVPQGMYRAEGMIRNVNTIEEYKNIDRSAIIERAGRTIWEAIHDGTILECPSLLASFTAICFADLKKHKFTYHFAFPALHGDPAWKLDTGDHDRHLSKEATIALVDKVQTWRYANDARQRGFFLAKRTRKRQDNMGSPVEADTPGFDQLGFSWVVADIRQFEHGFFLGEALEDRFICFADPSTYPENPGWPLRNLLMLMKKRWNLSKAQILCYRDTHARREQPNSLILRVDLPTPSTEDAATLQQEMERPGTPPMPKVVGWERDRNQKLNSRTVDLKEYMDPQRLADQAVDLNLKLIKWRIAPSIDLDIIKDTKCLLLGAGTLGSYVSRNLLGWGARKVTFVDNAKVSFSNPVRQPLFDFKDCLDGGSPKAERAAEALQEIYPGVDSEGYVMSVPMAGHPFPSTEEKKVKQDFERLKKLIDEHDAIFLLMDTRESRWLPTVMGKAAGKIVLNAALGFDSYVVMRHGLKPNGPGSEELGCYFCNDVVAPADSVKDATLDQQCTVTRPGVAPIASALLVELLVSILQHPLKGHAPAYNSQSQPQTRPIASPDVHPTNPESVFQHPLGALPHSIRGFMNNFSNMQITGQPYDCCSACSDKIINLYQRDGWNFVRRAINEKGWVEEISGLAEVQRRAEELDAAGWSDDDEDALKSEGEGELI